MSRDQCRWLMAYHVTSHPDDHNRVPCVVTCGWPARDSHMTSLQCLASSQCSALSMPTPLGQLQSTKRPEVFLHHCPVKCHIKPRKFKDYDNNLLALSRNFHDNFDGMMTTDPKSGAADVPLSAIKPPQTRAFREELVGNWSIKWAH